MNIAIKELKKCNGKKYFNFLKVFPESENGFFNPAKPENLQSMQTFKQWLSMKCAESKGINLEQNRMPQTIYWICIKKEVVGILKLRPALNDALRKTGGNLGIGILNQHRGKGIATGAIIKIKPIAIKKHGMTEILITNNETNIGSRKMAENAGGKLAKIENGICHYIIKL